MKPRGITLVELLVVVTIMMILVGVLIPRLRPSTQQRRVIEAARAVEVFLNRAKATAAASRFLSDDADVVVFGVLVRDVDPHEDDLRARASSLAAGCPARMALELTAVYMPAGSIAGFSKACTSNEESGDAD